MLPALAARLAGYASREGSVELFECARCHLGSWAAIVSAPSALCRLSWPVGVRLRGAPFSCLFHCFFTTRRRWAFDLFA